MDQAVTRTRWAARPTARAPDVDRLEPPQTPRGEWVQREVQLWEAAIVRGEKDYRPRHQDRLEGQRRDQPEGARPRGPDPPRPEPAASDADDLGLMLPVSPRAFWDWHPQFSMPVLRGNLLVDTVPGPGSAAAGAGVPRITRPFLEETLRRRAGPAGGRRPEGPRHRRQLLPHLRHH